MEASGASSADADELTLEPVEGEVRSVAWLWRPLGTKSGELRLAEGRLMFVQTDGAEVFNAPLAEIQIDGWPSYGIAPDSQVKLRANGKKHRVSFIMPKNSKQAQPSSPGPGPAYEHAERASKAIKTYPAGMKLGAAWRALLEQEMAG